MSIIINYTTLNSVRKSFSDIVEFVFHSQFQKVIIHKED